MKISNIFLKIDYLCTYHLISTTANFLLFYFIHPSIYHSFPHLQNVHAHTPTLYFLLSGVHESKSQASDYFFFFFLHLIIPSLLLLCVLPKDFRIKPKYIFASKINKNSQLLSKVEEVLSDLQIP